MALFKNRGNNLSRAGSVLEALAPKEKPEGEQTPPVVVETPPVVEGQQAETTPPVVETPPATIDTPPVVAATEDAPIVEGAEGAEGVATPPVTEVPPVTPVVETPPVVDISNEVIFEKLSEMLGRTVESTDDLKQNEIDPELAQLLEWKERTGLSLSEWSNYNRDFSQMGDMDVAREILAQKYPSFTSEELEYSLKNYVYDAELDDESDKIKKSIELKKFAAEGRAALEAKRLELVSSRPEATLTQEQQDAIQLAQSVQQQTQTVQQQQEAYNAGIAQASQSLESIDLKLSDDLTIKYNMPVEVKNSLPKMVAEMPHWYNEDGTYNHANVVKDVAKVTNFEAMVKAAYEQGIAVGTEGRIKVGANITIDGTQPTAQASGEQKGNVLDVVNKIAGGKTGSKLRFRTKK